ncbi:MAG: hypothetical protein HOV81_24300 [Kofleriaceae bacterium]|nr:hypothetical protein [Kofleriaceae bacterium]
MLLRASALLVFLAGCPFGGGDDAANLPECSMVDDQSMMLVASTATSSMRDIMDGSTVDLIGAPQGGHILLVGARVKASGDCQLQATASLRDTTTSRVIGLEQRALLLEMHANGWAAPRQGLDAMPNVAVCPSAAATQNIYGHPYLLEVALATMSGMPIVSASAMVTPTCATGDTYCQNDCMAQPPL